MNLINLYATEKQQYVRERCEIQAKLEKSILQYCPASQSDSDVMFCL